MAGPCADGINESAPGCFPFLTAPGPVGQDGHCGSGAAGAASAWLLKGRETFAPSQWAHVLQPAHPARLDAPGCVCPPELRIEAMLNSPSWNVNVRTACPLTWLQPVRSCPLRVPRVGPLQADLNHWEPVSERQHPRTPVAGGRSPYRRLHLGGLNRSQAARR